MTFELSRLLRRAPSVALALCVLFAPVLAEAQKKAAPGAADVSVQNFTSRPLILLLALVVLSLVPFVLMMVTSFVKISVVLSIIRSALGTQQIPPNQVITGLGIILTVYIMSPVGMEMYRSAEADITGTKGALLSSETVGQMLEAANRAKEPLRNFLLKKVTNKDRALFYNLSLKMRTEEDRKSIKDTDFMIIVPAFVVSELKEAFQIGFLLFVPFIVIDLVVSNILLALGMNMVSPNTVALPFKLLLFVLVDGWYLIAKGLVIGYL